MEHEGVSRRSVLRTVGGTGVLLAGATPTTVSASGDSSEAKTATDQVTLSSGGIRASSEGEGTGENAMFAEVEPTNGDFVRFGGETGRAIRLVNEDSGQSITFDPAADTAEYRMRELTLSLTAAELEEDTISLSEVGSSERARIDGEWTGDGGIFEGSVFATFAVELLADGSVVDRSDGHVFGTSYVWEIEQSGSTFRVSRPEGVESDWYGEFTVTERGDWHEDFYRETTELALPAESDWFEVDLQQFDVDSSTLYEWEIGLFESEDGQTIFRLVPMSRDESGLINYDRGSGLPVELVGGGAVVLGGGYYLYQRGGPAEPERQSPPER